MGRHPFKKECLVYTFYRLSSTGLAIPVEMWSAIRVPGSMG